MRFSEIRRLQICIALVVFNLINVLSSVGLLALGAHIKIQVQQIDHIYIGYDNSSLPWLLCCMGILCTVTSLMGALIFCYCYDPDKRESMRSLLLTHLILSLVGCVGVLASGSMCFDATTKLESALEHGIKQGMQRYAVDPISKVEIDELQLNYRCCGNEGYTDWFKIPWILDKYHRSSRRNVRSIEGAIDVPFTDKMPPVIHPASLHDSVPFSCCNPSVMRPCIHTDVHDNTAHPLYNFREDLTLRMVGCRRAVTDYFADTLLIKGGACVFVIFILQVTMLVLSRLLQTSMMLAIDRKTPLATSQAYMIYLDHEDDPPPYQSLIPKPLASKTASKHGSFVRSQHSIGHHSYSDELEPGEFDDDIEEDSTKLVQKQMRILPPRPLNPPADYR